MSYCKVYLHNVNDSPQSIETAPPGPRRRARAGRSAERELGLRGQAPSLVRVVCESA